MESKQRRIAFFTHYTELYGANMSLLNLMEGLRHYGVQSHVICPDRGDLLDALAKRGIPAAVLPFEWWVSTQRTVRGAVQRLYRNWSHLQPIVKQLTDWNTELVYSNSSVFAIGAMAAARMRLPHVWHLREFGNRDYDLWLDIGSQFARHLFLTADATIFVSNALKKAFLGTLNPPSTHVISNGVASQQEFDQRYEAAKLLRDRRQPFTFVLVGRFRPSKGQAIAIEAFAKVAKQYPDVRLLLVGGAGGTGDQSYFDQCRALVNDNQLTSRVEFWGYIPDPERAFLAADVALMCSRNEAMGRVTVEAMSACRPVIGYDRGGTSELIDEGRTGLLYRGEADTLAACMIQYIQNPALAQQHGEAGWHRCRERNSTETYAAQIHDVLSGIRYR